MTAARSSQIDRARSEISPPIPKMRASAPPVTPADRPEEVVEQPALGRAGLAGVLDDAPAAGAGPHRRQREQGEHEQYRVDAGQQQGRRHDPDDQDEGDHGLAQGVGQDPGVLAQEGHAVEVVRALVVLEAGRAAHDAHQVAVHGQGRLVVDVGHEEQDVAPAGVLERAGDGQEDGGDEDRRPVAVDHAVGQRLEQQPHERRAAGHQDAEDDDRGGPPPAGGAGQVEQGAEPSHRRRFHANRAAWRANSWAYRPSRSTSSSWVPRSTTWPPGSRT